MEQPHNQVLQVVDGFYGNLTIDFTDVIFRHKQEQYDHLRYHIGKQIQVGEEIRNYFDIRILFLGRTMLDSLAQIGVPEAYMDAPTPATHASLEVDTLARMEAEFE